MVSISALLDGNECAKYPAMTYGGGTFKKAKAEDKEKNPSRLV